ncbi:SDR family NAD(P)-dependent oxidoreductase [Streptomyces sp. BH105]|uniref:SDR family NAD(P)-dependent oxidoreductase n=1 Tax=Streptomyces sp. BH105 TaxID=3410408 RepID=UPI003CF2CD2D
MSRTAVVTGGASGLGRAICEQLAREGHHLAVLDRDGAAADAVAKELRAAGSRAMSVAVDVSARDDVEKAFARVRDQLGAVEVLVTSAGVSGFVPFEEVTTEDWDRMISVNLTGTFHCVQVAIPDMVAANWGRIVTISSAAGQTGALRQAHYSASKGGVIALTKTVALEYAARGITVNTVPPFTADTPLLRAAQESGQLPRAEALARMVPAGRLGTGEEIAAVCAFLCSDAAGYVTGQVIGVNGGAVT